MKPEKLIRLYPSSAGVQYGRETMAVPMGSARVLMAVPRLALTCLQAREVLRGRPGLDLQECLKTLETALAAAGVEVEP